MKFESLILAVLLSVSLFSAADVNEDMKERGAIFSFLLDTGVHAADTLPPQTLQEKSGWSIVEEEDAAHAFQGDAVLLNDKIAVVLRAGSAGAEVYALGAEAPVYRATLMPKPVGGAKAALAGLEILENHPGAIMVRAAFKTGDAQNMSLDYRLTTGQIQVEMRPGAGVDFVRVAADTDYLVVPDFFADDLVYTPYMFDTPWTGLPAENFFFHLAGAGDAIVTCVWESTGRNSRVLFSGEGAERRIGASEIECIPGKSVWAAFMEKADTWHALDVPGGSSAEVKLDWKPPFSAKWRADFVTTDEQAASWNFQDSRADDAPCWLEGDTPWLQFSAPKNTPVIIYPIDRTQKTPLNLFLLVDTMRGTLGVGPCQYILDLEGLDAQTSPTPALVCDWIGSRFKKKRAAKDADKIRERLAAMVGHVEHAEQRIAHYRAFAEKMRSALAEVNVNASALDTILNDKNAQNNVDPHIKAEALAKKLTALLGEEAWEAPFNEINGALHDLGTQQDRSLSRYRMALRRLKQACIATEANAPETTEISKNIIAQINCMLQDEN
jgi:hypothetical protein